MKFSIGFERKYPHPAEAVWNALTSRAALAEWLMDSDFAPEVGHEFSMRCEGEGEDEASELYRCEVLELDPRKRMLWSWMLEGSERAEPTFVEFTVEAVADGTIVRIQHSGDRKPPFIDKFKAGWPLRLDSLRSTLNKRP